MSTLESALDRGPVAQPVRSSAPEGQDAGQAARAHAGRRWRWAVLGLGAASLGLTLLVITFLAMKGWGQEVRVFIEDVQVFGGPDLQEMSVWNGLKLGFAIAVTVSLTLLILFVVLPLTVAAAAVVGMLAGVLALALGLGLPLLALLLMAGMLLSPLILLGWLLFKLLRGGSSR